MTTSSITLELGDQTAVVDPLGGRLTRYRVRGQDVLAGREDPELYAYRGALLAPWPNRLTDGRWTWQGQDLQLPLDDPTGVDAALHGLVVQAPFTVEHRAADVVRLAHQMSATPGYPFPLRIEVSYALTPQGVDCALTAVNTGDGDAPVGLGVHPYVAACGLVDDLALTLPAATTLVTDPSWREIARTPVQEAGLDFRRPRSLQGLELDAGFTDLEHAADGRIEVVVRRPDGTLVLLSAGSTCRWLLVYTGHTLPGADLRRSLAVEPMTCPPNALATGEVDVVAPGESLTLEWRFSLG